jgi:ATP-dependent RNA helicase HelY
MSTTDASSVREQFENFLPFDLDEFQRAAMDALDDGASVVVAAPTGSGKTIVAEYAVAKALADGGKAFYTTPIKALSNQKYAELRDRHGADRVGLLTGDTSINDNASIVVMTTEVLRNMIYAGSRALQGLRYVVLDEVHFLQDTYRGSVWEEVIINTAPEVDLVCLSATVSNAEMLADWVTSVRGRTIAVVHTIRPIELKQLYLVGDPATGDVSTYDVFVDGVPNKVAARLDAEAMAPDVRQRRRRVSTPRRTDVVDTLKYADLLPALYFIFSRAQCDEAVRTLLHSGYRLTLPDERERIRDIVEAHVEALTDDDLHALDFSTYLAALECGIAGHHAGMVPAFREAVEKCFVEGLVKVVFATETLALGINMPARTVVIEKLSKYTGTGHQVLTPAEYTQLTGRAGRRGIDNVGYAATLWSPFTPFEQVAELAGKRTYELRSAFRPTFNMAANLVRRTTRERAEDLLMRSFAQFQVDAELVRGHVKAERMRKDLAEARAAAQCEKGDVSAYRAKHRQWSATSPAASVGEVTDALRGLRPGAVIRIEQRNGTTRGSSDGVVVISRSDRKDGDIRLKALTGNGKEMVITAKDLRVVPEVVTTVKLPSPFAPGTKKFTKGAVVVLNHALGRTGRRRQDANPVDRDLVDLGNGERTGVASCPDLETHLRACDRADALERELARQEAVAKTRSRSIVGHLGRVVDVLSVRGHLSGWKLTESGQVLAGLFHECDLLIAECLDERVFDELKPPMLAALVSSLIYERRGPSPGRNGDARLSLDLPRDAPKGLGSRWRDIVELAEHLNDDEHRAGLPLTRLPDPGFMSAAFAWANGKQLDQVLEADSTVDISGGDFVRTIRALIDLLRQIGTVAPNPSTGSAARSAADALHRGVVAVSSSTAIGTV